MSSGGGLPVDRRLRYSRQTVLPEWGEDGQQRLASCSVLIVGLGGLGHPAANYLASAGVGRLVLNDFDTVDASNLPRQTLFGPGDIDRPKVVQVAAALSRLNPDAELCLRDQRLDGDSLISEIRQCDVVLDASDNFSTRFAVNAACVAAARPLVSGAAIRFEGQLAVFRADLGGGACYRCLYDEHGEALENCQGQGVFTPVVGVVGAMMASEALKIMLGMAATADVQLSLFDARSRGWHSAKVQPDPACPVCGGDR